MPGAPEVANLLSFEWIELFSVLSLDLTIALEREMGLRLSDPSFLRSSLRAIIRSNERAFQDWPETGDLIRTQWRVVDIELLALEQRWGEIETSRFLEWVKITFASLATRRRWLPYMQAFRAWAAKLTRTGDDFLNLTARSDVLGRYRTDNEMAEVDKTIDDVKRMPLSAWDQTVFMLRRYSKDPAVIHKANESSDYMVLRDPFELICDTVAVYKFQKFWRNVAPTLGREGSERLFSFVASQWPGTDLVRPEHLDAVVD